MKNKKILTAVLIVLILSVICFGAFKALRFVMDKYHYLRDTITQINDNTKDTVKQYLFDYSWIEDRTLVAHAFGGKGTKTYTNALEAFVYNYDLGHRVFEVDFDLTTDNVTILSHDEEYWRYITDNENSDVDYSYENFMNTPLFTDYTPLDYKDLVDLLCKYPDIYIITDTKYSDELNVYKQFSQITDYAKEKDPEVLDRIIPQFYTKEMLDYVMNVYPFKSAIFTLYQIVWDREDIAKFCIKSGVKYITVSSEAVGDEDIALWRSMGINIAVHTVNEQEIAEDFLGKGVRMIYTDFLLPETEVNTGNE